MLPRQPVRALVMAIWLVFLFGSTNLLGARIVLSQAPEPSRQNPIIPCPPRPIPPPPGCESKKQAPAMLGIRLMSDPNGSVSPGQTAAYRIEAQNSGSRGARDIRITLSFA